jgi:hypothetical protein
MDLMDFYLNERAMEMHVAGARGEAQADRLLHATIVERARQDRKRENWLCELNYRMAIAGEWLAQFRPLQSLGVTLQDVRFASACS